MKKRLIAILCLLALAIGIFAVTATAAGTQDQTKFDVGYAKINITPYVWYYESEYPSYYAAAKAEAKFTDPDGNHYCYYDSDSDGVYDVLHLPQRGSGNVWNRPGTTVIDDNGDGVVDLNDGLFITCMSVTDSNDKTVLFVSVDLIGSDQIKAMRDAAASRLSGKVTSDSIFYAGTHTHTAPDLSVRGAKAGDTNYCVDTFADPDVTHTFTYDDMNTDLDTWYGHLQIAMADVAEQAYNSRKAATVTKGEIEANGSNTGNRTMVSTRHYVSTDSNGEKYYNGDNFNTRASGTSSNDVKQVTQVDETLYMLEFTFTDGKTAPIAFTNWRGHPSLNNSASYKGNRNAYSSDFINPYRYELSKKENGGYRVIYFNGTGGNTNPRGYEWNTAFTKAANGDSYADGTIDYWWIDNEKDETGVYQGRAITYGRRLADVALKCLKNNMNPVTGGDEIRTYQYSLSADRQAHSDLAYYACQAAQTFYATGNSGVFKYPSAVLGWKEVTNETYDAIRAWAKKHGATDLNKYASKKTIFGVSYDEAAEEQFYIYAAQADLDLEKADAIVATAKSYASSGEYYNVASKFHANSVVGKWTPTDGDVAGHIKVTTKVSMELNAFVLGDNLAFVTAPGEPFDYYDENGSTVDKDNDWLELRNDATYGTPFILGYCNGSNGYIPNAKAYSYNTGSANYAVGSYESQSTALAQGTGEQMVAQLKKMLTAVSAEDFYYTAECEHCGTPQEWIPYNGKGDQSGHYYLVDDMDAAQIIIQSDVKICLDLNGKTFRGDKRAFTSESNTNCELSIMDTSAGKTGRVEGCGGTSEGFGGAVINCGSGLTFNLYGGTVATYEKEGYMVGRGGVVLVRGTFNMYDGMIEGGSAVNYGASVDIGTSGNYKGTFNMHGGVITNGTITSTTGKGSCVYIESGTTMNLYGGDIHEILFAKNMATSLTVHGNYTGTAKIAQSDTTFALGAVVGKTATYQNTVADVSLGNITVGDTGYYAAVKGSQLIVSEKPYTYADCEVCKSEKQWIPLNDAAADALGDNIAGGHYRVVGQVTTAQKLVAKGATVCLDLNGQTYTGQKRAFYTNADYGSTLNLMDSSKGETGKLLGRGTADGAKMGFGGGTLFIAAGNELNIYSGSFGFEEMADYSTYAGAVVFTRGTVNMYGGTIEGGTVTSFKGTYNDSAKNYIGRGGAIYADGGTLSLSDGVITTGKGAIHAASSGETAPYALCVFITAKTQGLHLSDDVNIDEIYFAGDSAELLTVDAAYAGKAALAYGTLPELGSKLGAVDGVATEAHSVDIAVTGGSYAAIKGADLVYAQLPYTYGKCEICGDCQWMPVDKNYLLNHYNNGIVQGHYRLSGNAIVEETDVKNSKNGQILLNHSVENPQEHTVCFDLAGYTYQSRYRAFYVDNKATLNIFDSAGDGQILGYQSTNTSAGGALYVSTGGTINLYSGTVALAEGSSTPKNGGIMYAPGGTFNMYGGSLIGANTQGSGAAIYNTTGTLNIKGGTITGAEAATGSCIYVGKTGKVTVSNTAKIADIYFENSSADTFTVEAPFTGSAQLTYAKTPVARDDIGNFKGNGTLSADALRITDVTAMSIEVEGSDLILVSTSAASINGEIYATLSNAIDHYKDGETIVLMKNSTENISGLDKTVYLDLNGFDISGNISVNEGYTLYCKDSQTDEYSLEQDSEGNYIGYGKLTGTLDGDIQAVAQKLVGAYNLEGNAYSYKSGYLKITEADGTSFHALNLKLTEASLRPANVGFYYTSAFEGDQIIQRNLKTYGVVLSVVEEPTVENMDTYCEYSTLPTQNFNTGTGTGTLLEGVMKTTNYNSFNKRNAAMDIHGKSYIALNDGTVIFGDYAVMSLQQFMEAVDETVYSVNGVPNNAKELYKTYSAVMSRWDVPNIKKAIADDKAQENA